MRLGPFQLARLALHLEVLVAFGAAEAEGAGVVANEGYAFGGVDGAGTEVACFNSGNGQSLAGCGSDISTEVRALFTSWLRRLCGQCDTGLFL